jgi:hypothetical protein
MGDKNPGHLARSSHLPVLRAKLVQVHSNPYLFAYTAEMLECEPAQPIESHHE